MATQRSKALTLRRLHHGPRILILPNAWDAASARIFEDAGFPAIATTSGGVAFSLGYPDGENVPRDGMIDAIHRIARSVSVPASMAVARRIAKELLACGTYSALLGGAIPGGEMNRLMAKRK